MKKLLLILVFAAALMGRAQETAPDKASVSSKIAKYVTAGMETAGVRYPHYDADGNLQAQVYGQFVKVLEGTTVEITNLKIDLYREGKVAATIFAPQCISNVDIRRGGKKGNELNVHSDGPVLMESTEMSLSGRGFVLKTDGKQFHFEVLHDSKVLVKEAAQELEGVKL